MPEKLSQLGGRRMPDDRFKPGAKVRIRYLTRPSEEATIVDFPNERGWVLVEQPYRDEKVQFEAAIEYVTVLDA